MTNTNRIISSVILAACFPIMAILPSHPASLLFIFVSGNKWVSTIRLALALILLALSFGLIRLPKSARKPLIVTGLGMISFSFVALLATSLGSFLYDYMKILDVMITMEAGIIFCSLAMAMAERPQAVKAKKRAKAKAMAARATTGS